MKYIHYCWFGKKPLPKLAKKCIRSWKKYLPDYKIIKWSEENVDLNECPFIKEAYENKKWAFVADYARTKAIKEKGGIYFDTDMEVIKNIDNLLKDKAFLGIEDTGKIACGVWYESKENSYLATELLDKYKKFKHFSTKEMYKYSIPILITDILEKKGFKYNEKGIQKLEDGTIIYPREYFYPYSYNRENNIFTDNTHMIHYYDASWLPLKSRIENHMIRKIGRNNTINILNIYRKTKNAIRKTAKLVLFPIVIYRNVKRKNNLITKKYLTRIDETINNIDKFSNEKYLVFHNKEYLGVTSATKELFENLVDCGELYRKEDVKKIGDKILEKQIKNIIFSSLSIGEKNLIKYLKDKDKKIKIKIYWHGSHSQILDQYGFDRMQEFISFQKEGYVDCIATCKKSLYNFYKSQGIKVYFLTNKVHINDIKKLQLKQNKNNEIIIGLYAAKCDDWRKNMFSQIAAISLIPNAVLDMVPLNEKAISFANSLGLKWQGENKNIPREELLERMSKNSANIYVTYSECAPMLPLESMELQVPCISGNNHHYFENDKVSKYLKINNETDIEEIYKKLIYCIKNKDEVIKEYNKFSKSNDKNCKKLVDKFLGD